MRTHYVVGWAFLIWRTEGLCNKKKQMAMAAHKGRCHSTPNQPKRKHKHNPNTTQCNATHPHPSIALAPLSHTATATATATAAAAAPATVAATVAAPAEPSPSQWNPNPTEQHNTTPQPNQSPELFRSLTNAWKEVRYESRSTVKNKWSQLLYPLSRHNPLHSHCARTTA